MTDTIKKWEKEYKRIIQQGDYLGALNLIQKLLSHQQHLKKEIERIDTHEPGILNGFIPCMDVNKTGDWISKYWVLQALDGKEIEN